MKLARATSSSSSPTSVAFLQRRVALAGLAGGLLGGSFWLFRLITYVVSGHYAGLVEPNFAWHLLGALLLLMCWPVLHGKPRSRAFVNALESFAFISSAVAYVAMGADLASDSRPDMIVLLALTYGYAARAIYVPSTATRTAVLTAISGIPLLIMTWVVYEAHQRAGKMPVLTDESIVIGVISLGVWWSLTVSLCTLASRVIFGLRTELSQARKLGQYTLGEELGAGGMGQVYRATHARLRRPVAIKLLRPDQVGETNLARFEREAQLTAMLCSPHTVELYDYGQADDGTFYFVMELLDGLDLQALVEHFGPLPPERVAHLLTQACHSLGEAHALGLTHRDIKPANLLVCRYGRDIDFIKVLDFGLAKNVEVVGGFDTNLTIEGATRGTPAYMAPEAALGESNVDCLADIYALGCVAYFLLTSVRVFEADTSMKMMLEHIQAPPVPLSQRVAREFPRALEALVMQCLEKDRAARPQSADVLCERLAAIEFAEPWTEARARAWWDALGSKAVGPAQDPGARPLSRRDLSTVEAT